MFSVTIDTERSVDIPREGLLAVEALLVLVENELVAAAAGLGLLGHQMRLADTFDVMDAVAVGADGGELDKPFSKKGLAVNALHVFVIGHFAVDVVLDDDAHILMAGRACQGDVLPAD